MSDEQNDQPSDAPDGDDANANEVMTRREAKRLIKAREQLKAGNDALLAENQELSKRLAELQKQVSARTGGASNTGEPTEWATTLIDQIGAVAEKLTALEQQFGDYRSLSARERVEAAVLAEVPDGNHTTAKALLGALDVDFTQPGAAADALAKLRESHPAVMVDHTRGAQPRAPANRPDGSPDFSVFKTFDEVPDAYKVAAMRDPETFKRLRNGVGPAGGLKL